MEPIILRYVKNYRDLGGIKTADGHTLKPGMLIRGTTLKKLHASDIQLLKAEYNLHTIIDLRTPKEAQEKPDVVPEGVNYRLRPVFDEALLGISHEKKVRSMQSLVNLPSMETLYVEMVNPRNLENLTAILREILLMPEEDFSLIFHCSAGKDRTGVLAALLLSFLGVDRTDILNDYLYTNRVNRMKAKLAYVAAIIVKRDTVFAKKVRQYLLAEEEYITASLNSIEQQFGSVENFFSEKLQFSDKEISEIRAKFLA